MGDVFKVRGLLKKPELYKYNIPSLYLPWLFPNERKWYRLYRLMTVGVLSILLWGSKLVRFLTKTQDSFPNIFNQNFKKSTMDFENSKIFQIWLTLRYSEFYFVNNVNWTKDWAWFKKTKSLKFGVIKSSKDSDDSWVCSLTTPQSRNSITWLTLM